MNVKCPQCGLVNFADAETCKRCEHSLAGAQPVVSEQMPAAAPTVPPPDTTPAAAVMQSMMTKAQGYALIGLAFFALLLALWLALRPQPKYEYKAISFMSDAPSRDGDGALRYSTIQLNEGELASLGNDGWELVGSYLEMETAFPNFGKSEYVTGLQPNVRPQKAVLIFRRQK